MELKSSWFGKHGVPKPVREGLESLRCADVEAVHFARRKNFTQVGPSQYFGHGPAVIVLDAPHAAGGSKSSLGGFIAACRQTFEAIQY